MITCRHCRKRFAPKGRALLQDCPHCEKKTLRRRAKRSELLMFADDLFSVIVRTSAADAAGHAYCVTCRRVFLWTDLEAGHFVCRSNWTLRWDEDNVHPQCHSCNGFNEGRKFEYGKWIDTHLGEGIAEQLITISLRPQKKPKNLELIQLASGFACVLRGNNLHEEVNRLASRNKAAAAEIEIL